uniref:Uncharacterized protein n=1 Tax=Equus caballus TaxID=9796 RepID=A0A9L0SXU6_HORSE
MDVRVVSMRLFNFRAADSLSVIRESNRTRAEVLCKKLSQDQIQITGSAVTPVGRQMDRNDTWKDSGQRRGGRWRACASRATFLPVSSACFTTLQLPGLLPGSSQVNSGAGAQESAPPSGLSWAALKLQEDTLEQGGGASWVDKFTLAEPGEALVRACSLQAASPSCPLTLLHPRSRMVLGATEAFHLLVNHRSVASVSVTVAEIYRDCKDEDGFVYMTCSSQETPRIKKTSSREICTCNCQAPG